MRRLLILLVLAGPSLAVTITCPPLTITTPVNLPKAANHTPYKANLAAYAKPTGGVPPYTFTLNPTNPVPPWWLKISPTGIASGTPNRKGTFTFSFTVTDSCAKAAQSGQGSVNVNPPDGSYVPSGDKHAR